MADIRPITVQELRDLAGDMFVAHWDEVAPPAPLEFDPDWGSAITFERTGLLFVLGAFDGDRLIGYSVNALRGSAVAQRTPAYTNLALFVEPERRKGGTGLALIRETERTAAARGARQVVFHAKPGSPLHGLMPRLGYAAFCTVFARELRERD